MSGVPMYSVIWGRREGKWRGEEQRWQGGRGANSGSQGCKQGQSGLQTVAISEGPALASSLGPWLTLQASHI